MNTVIVLAGFAAIVLAPVAAAYFFGAKPHKGSGSHKIARPEPEISDPVHLRPRPRRRKR